MDRDMRSYLGEQTSLEKSSGRSKYRLSKYIADVREA